MRKSFWWLFLLLGCTNQGEIQQKLSDAYNNLNEDEYIERVLELNNKYSNNFYINIDLAYIYLLDSDYENAELCFKTAEDNIVDNDTEWKYKLYSGLSDLYYAQSKWNSSISAGKKALESNSADPSVVKLTIARANSKSKNFKGTNVLNNPLAKLV